MTDEGKRLRAELLVQLRERSGFKYSELAEIDLFGELNINNLVALHHSAPKKEGNSWLM